MLKGTQWDFHCKTHSWVYIQALLPKNDFCTSLRPDIHVQCCSIHHTNLNFLQFAVLMSIIGSVTLSCHICMAQTVDYTHYCPLQSALVSTVYSSFMLVEQRLSEHFSTAPPVVRSSTEYL